ncbi:SRPBCC family protein [Gordonia soli]|uniref:Polyketide cyclase/dehydrase n=1 Tax=Gordonia soli NBRC 108243 TaxID=1223545 RepID=M0QID2_9ACTN|nr:SRPBCC family protein [Gordonia soli]GAC67197.1 hypothetical protein GS4_06_00430 [Gordonia soli NBRC 108243]
MTDIEIQHTFPASADTVWSWIGRTGDIASWIPAITTSRVDEDNVRHVVFADGEPARERITAFADDARTYTYTYIDGPLPLKHYESTISVTESTDGGADVRWAASFGAESAEVEAELATAISGIYSDALAELENQIGAA